MIGNFPATLDYLIAVLEKPAGFDSMGLVAALKDMKRWAGPTQRVGILNKNDLVEMVGQEGMEHFLRILVSVT